MKKEQYLALVRRYLSALPPEDIERSLAFYQECIEDRMEDGMTEEEAVASLESPEAAARAILMDMPIPKLVKARARSAGSRSSLNLPLTSKSFCCSADRKPGRSMGSKLIPYSASSSSFIS